MLFWETAVLLAAFAALIWLFTRENRLGGIHWYPKHVQQAAVERGLTDKAYIAQRAKRTKLLGLVMIAVIVLGSVFGINRADRWLTAALQIYTMLFVMNLFDAVVVDYLWVRKTNYWRIEELADLEIAKPTDYLLKERVIAALVYIPLSALFGCIAFAL